MSLLGDRLLALAASFSDHGIPHAFGGAIALAYCASEPRGTIDIDVNVFVGLDKVDEVLEALPAPVTVTKANRVTARKGGQARVRWGEMPIDLFFSVHDFHLDIAHETREVPFQDGTISILSCDALVVFKAIFNRTRDWADIEAIVKAGAVDTGRTLNRLTGLLGPGDPAVVRLRALAE